MGGPGHTTALKGIIATVLYNHTRRGCLFAPGARERIFTTAAALWDKLDAGQAIGLLDELFKGEEIYCSHEGIDRRAEFGIERS